MYDVREVEDYLYTSASFWHPRFGPFSCDNLIRRFQHNGFPGITEAEIRAVHAGMVARGTLLDTGEF